MRKSPRESLLFAMLTASLISFLPACALKLKPTKVYSTRDVDALYLEKQLHRPVKILPDTIIVDARSNFEFAMLHAPQAVHLKPSDFTATPQSGELNVDLDKVTLRLSLLGITPKSHIVVVSGDKGTWPEAGQVAWSLLYLGVQNVQMANLDTLGLRYSNITPPPRTNAPNWQPRLAKRLLLEKAELLRLSGLPESSRPVVIDVRSPAEHSADLKRFRKITGFDSLNLAWDQFFNKQARPNFSMRKKLAAQQILPDRKIVVISNRGRRSAAVSYALTAMGYTNAANFAGGFDELFDLQQE